MDQKTTKQKAVHSILYWGLPVLAVVLIAVGWISFSAFNPELMPSPAQVWERLVKTFTKPIAKTTLFGHGFYKGPVDIHVDILEKCREFTDIPFVLHGCTGMDETLIRQAVKAGVAKINFGTQVRCNYINYVKDGLAQGKDEGHAWKLSSYTEKRLREDIKDIIRLAGSAGKA